jgi:hypothetical protein
MPFERFKAKHGGMGPAQAFYAGLSGGEGLFGQWRPSFVRERMGATVDAITNDTDLPAEFREEAESYRNSNLTVPEAFAAINGLQQRARDIRTVGSAFKGFGEQQTKLRGAAMTPEDTAQLDVLDTQADYGRRLMLSSNPELQAMGRAVTEKVFSGQQSFATANEAQRLAAEASLGPERWTKYSALQDNYRQESAPFLEQRAAFARIKAALATPDSPAGDQALVFNFMKMLDPGSAVLPGEYASASNTAGVPDAVLTLYNRVLREGQRLTPEQRADFFKQATAQLTAGQGQQTERDTRYLGQARDVGLPESMLGHFQMPRADSTGDPASFGTPQAALGGGGGAADLGDTPVDSTSTQIGRSVVSGAQTFGKRVGDFLGGVFDIRGGGAQQRPTDEYAAPAGSNGTFNRMPVQRDGTVNGVYVPPFLRDRRQ